MAKIYYLDGGQRKELASHAQAGSYGYIQYTVSWWSGDTDDPYGDWIGKEIGIEFTGAGGPHFAHFDDVEMHWSGVPEPASMALLALGGLAVVRRKRAR